MKYTVNRDINERHRSDTPDNKYIERINIMRKKEELKTVRKTVLMTESLERDIKQEAEARGIKPNTVMCERLSHKNGLTPETMGKIQNLTNHASRLVEEYAPQDTDRLNQEANELWIFLHRNA